MKALVTGGAGFIGSNIVKLLLKKGYKVIVLDNLSTGYRHNLLSLPEVEFIEADILDTSAVTSAMNSVDVVFHLAASVGNVRSLENPILDSKINVLGTLNILQAARRFDVQKVVYSSSAAIFGELKYLPIGEDHPLDPDTPYAVSKLAGEKYCLSYARLYDIEAICLRYFNVYGVNQYYDAYGNVIPIFATRQLAGKPLTIYGDGEQTRDFVNVKDVAQANFLAAEAKGISGTFNIGCGEAITINELARLMQNVSGLPTEIIHTEPRKGDVRHSRANISAVSSQLGFVPTVSLEEGLLEYFAWLKTVNVEIV